MALPFIEHTVIVRTSSVRVDGDGVTLPPGVAQTSSVKCVVDNTDAVATARQLFSDIDQVSEAAIIVYINPEDADTFVPDRSELDYEGKTYYVAGVRKQPSAVTTLSHAIVLADVKA